MPAASDSYLKLCHLADESGLTVELSYHDTARLVNLWVLTVGTEERRVTAQAQARDVSLVLGKMADAILDQL